MDPAAITADGACDDDNGANGNVPDTDDAEAGSGSLQPSVVCLIQGEEVASNVAVGLASSPQC